MKLARTLGMTLTVAVTIFASIQLPAQEPDENAPATDSAKVTYAPTAGGFGDLAAAHAYEMSAVTGELEGKLDSKTAKAGDRVVLKTMDKVQASDGTVIPRGARLVGHVTEAQAYNEQHGPARIAIAFDHAELKNGQSISVHTLIRAVTPSASAMNMSQMNDDNVTGMQVPGGGRANGGRMGPGYGSVAAPNGPGGPPEGPVDRTAAETDAENDRVDMNSGSTAQAGDGLNTDAGAHGVAAARARPHPTGIPGVMLAGNSTSSGVLLAPRENIQIESGTEIQLGVAADR
jgi:hypothetical protein